MYIISYLFKMRERERERETERGRQVVNELNKSQIEGKTYNLS